jgi:hypothetical protein
VYGYFFSFFFSYTNKKLQEKKIYIHAPGAVPIIESICVHLWCVCVLCARVVCVCVLVWCVCVLNGVCVYENSRIWRKSLSPLQISKNLKNISHQPRRNFLMLQFVKNLLPFP